MTLQIHENAQDIPIQESNLSLTVPWPSSQSGLLLLLPGKEELGCIQFWLLVEPSAAPAVISAADKIRKLNSEAGVHPSLTPLNHPSCDKSALTLLKFVPC